MTFSSIKGILGTFVTTYYEGITFQRANIRHIGIQPPTTIITITVVIVALLLLADSVNWTWL